MEASDNGLRDAVFDSGVPPADVMRQRRIEMCGLRILRTTFESDRAILAMLERYASRKYGPPSILPVAIPLFVDLVSLVLSPVPLLRRIPVARDKYDVELEDRYRDRILCRLGHLPAVRHLRGRLQADVPRARRDEVAGQFVCRILSWLSKHWLEWTTRQVLAGMGAITFPLDRGRVMDAARDIGIPSDVLKTMRDGIPSRIQTEDELLQELRDVVVRRLLSAGRGVLFIQDGHTTRWLLLQLIDAIGFDYRPAAAVTPLDRFLLGAGIRLPRAFSAVDLLLIEMCLRSGDLDEGAHRPVPLRIHEEWPEVMSSYPGEYLDVHRVRTTTDLSRLSQALPQELAILRTGADGRRHLVNKITREGLLIWERRRLVRKEDRRRFLVCFVADIGVGAVHAAASGTRRGAFAPTTGTTTSRLGTPARAASTAGNMSIHAQRLIVDSLRDIARFVDAREVDLTARIFLEPVGGPTRERLGWEVSLDDLVRSASGERYEFMLEVERRAPGYFFRERMESRRRPEGHFDYIERVLAEESFDLALFVFLGPQRTVRTELIPIGAATGNGTRIETVIVRPVELGRWADWVETSSSGDFLGASIGGDARVVRDEDLRLSVLTDLLGPRVGDAAVQELRFEGDPS